MEVRLSEFQANAPDTKNSENEKPPSLVSKDSSSSSNRPERANRGYNPKYDQETYLGLQVSSGSGFQATSTSNEGGLKKLNSPEEQTTKQLGSTVHATTSIFTTSVERGMHSTV